MWPHSLPYMRVYPPVYPVRFMASPTGSRTSDELAEFLGLARMGLISFQRHRGCGSYGPKHNSVAYTDEAIAMWLLRMTMTEQSWLNYYQHIYPSASSKKEAEASTLKLIEAASLIKN